MFLDVLNQEEREKCMQLFSQIIKVDDDYNDYEQEILERYLLELGFTSLPDITDSLEDLIDYFAAKSDSIKRILYFELCGLIMADEAIRPEEQQVLDSIIRKFEIDPEIMEQISKSVIDLKAVYDNIYRILA